MPWQAVVFLCFIFKPDTTWIVIPRLVLAFLCQMRNLHSCSGIKIWQGTTLMVALLSGASWISIRASRFCQQLARQASSFSGQDMIFSIFYTFSSDGQVNQLSEQVQFWCNLPSGQALENLNVTPCMKITREILDSAYEKAGQEYEHHEKHHLLIPATCFH